MLIKSINFTCNYDTRPLKGTRNTTLPVISKFTDCITEFTNAMWSYSRSSIRAGESSLKSGAYAEARSSSSMPLWAGLWDGATSTSSATSTVSPHTTSAPVTVKTVAPEECQSCNTQDQYSTFIFHSKFKQILIKYQAIVS